MLLLLIGDIQCLLFNEYGRLDLSTSSCLSTAVAVQCDEPPAPALNKAAYCEANQWVWNNTACPVAKLSATKVRVIDLIEVNPIIRGGGGGSVTLRA